MDIKSVQRECHSIATDKGWWDKDRTFGEIISLMHSELSEALEFYREKGDFCNIYIEDGSDKPEGVVVELADCVIRILDFCGRYDLDLEGALRLKIEYNKTRPYRHGGRVL